MNYFLRKLNMKYKNRNGYNIYLYINNTFLFIYGNYLNLLSYLLLIRPHLSKAALLNKFGIYFDETKPHIIKYL